MHRLCVLLDTLGSSTSTDLCRLICLFLRMAPRGGDLSRSAFIYYREVLTASISLRSLSAWNTTYIPILQTSEREGKLCLNACPPEESMCDRHHD